MSASGPDGQPFRPNLFVLGAAKCGTTTLYAHLDRFPEVCMSRPKEPFFFECEYGRGVDFYRRTYFAHWKGEPWIGEARHRNLYLPYVPARVREVNPGARLLAVLRDPTERAFSHWWHLHVREFDPLPFAEAIRADHQRIESGRRLDTAEEEASYCSRADNVTYYRTYLDSGYYAEQIERYLALFPAAQLEVVLLDELRAEPAATVNRVRRFLGLEPLPGADFAARRDNQEKLADPSPVELRLARMSGLKLVLPVRARAAIARWLGRRRRRRSAMDAATEGWLRDHFRPHNQRLAALLGRDLGTWDRKVG